MPNTPVVVETPETPERATVESTFVGSADFRVTPTKATSKGRARGIVAYAKASQFQHEDGTSYSGKSIACYAGKFSASLVNRTVTITASKAGRSIVAGMSQEEIDALSA